MRQCLLIIVSFAFVLPSCKKGKDDPFFSLRTRKNRLTGEWKVESYQRTRDYSDTIKAELLEGGQLLYTFADSSSLQIGYHWELQFDRDGGYVSNERKIYERDTILGIIADTIDLKEEGSWEFTGGNGEPSKSQLLFQTEQITTQRSSQGSNIDIRSIKNPVDGRVYKIDRITNKELWLSYKVTRAYAFAQREESVVVRFTKAD